MNGFMMVFGTAMVLQCSLNRKPLVLMVFNGFVAQQALDMMVLQLFQKAANH